MKIIRKIVVYPEVECQTEKRFRPFQGRGRFDVISFRGMWVEGPWPPPEAGGQVEWVMVLTTSWVTNQESK